MIDEIRGVLSIFAAVSYGGMGLVVFVIWYYDLKKERHKEELRRKEFQKLLDQQREAMAEFRLSIEKMGSQNTEFMIEMRQMYVNNASLVKRYQEQTGDMKDAYLLAAETIGQFGSKLEHYMDNNTFCPIVRERTGRREVKLNG